MRRWILLTFAVALFRSILPVAAAGLIIVDDPAFRPGPAPLPPPPELPRWRVHPPRIYAFAPLEIQSVNVSTRIRDQIATTSITQEFYNPNPSRLEGTFVFPVPKGAHLDKFMMDIDGKTVEAELLSADKGRRIYEDIVRKLRDPALLEYADRDLFKVRIFPIEPNNKKRISLSYTQLLKADNGLLNYVLPLSTEKFSCKPVKNLTVQLSLETGHPLKSIYSSTHNVEIKREGPNRATVVYETTDASPDADFSLYFAPEKEDLGINLLTFRRPGEDGYFVLLASPGLDGHEKVVLPKDVVFVLDTSGSMAGKKLEQAKKALTFCIENLNRHDRFELIRFSTEVEPLFNGLVEANQNNQAKAEDFVKDLKPLGATAIDDALKRALNLQRDEARNDGPVKTVRQSHPFIVVFLTDGCPTIGVTDEDQIVKNVKQENHGGQTRIFCFGIGTDVNTHLLDKITEQTRAFSQYVLPEEDLEVKVSSFFSKIKEPVLANPALRFTGDIRPSKQYPSALPDLFNGEQLVLVGRYAGQGDAAAIVEGSVNGQSKQFSYDVKFKNETDQNDFIPRLWATRRVGYLLDEIRLHGDNAELRDEVSELARKYAIVTPYTSYLIAEDEVRRDVPVPLRSVQDFEKDGALRREAAQSWQQFSVESTGDAGVASALSGQALKSANAAAPAAVGAGRSFLRRYGLPASTPPSQASPAESRLDAMAQSEGKLQFVAGKTFFQGDTGWVDSAIQKAKDVNRSTLKFGSEEYFTFGEKHPQALAWLALGQNVQFLLENTIYEIQP